jgi:hypothetical protein
MTGSSFVNIPSKGAERDRGHAPKADAMRNANGAAQEGGFGVKTEQIAYWRAAVRLSAWACLIMLALLSWLPGDEMIRSGLNGRLEHTLAYTCAGSIVALAYAGRFGLLGVTCTLTIYAGVLEIGQGFVVARHPSLLDFLASTSGILIGSAFHPVLRTGVRRRHGLRHLLASLAE